MGVVLADGTLCECHGTKGNLANQMIQRDNCLEELTLTSRANELEKCTRSQKLAICSSIYLRTPQ